MGLFRSAVRCGCVALFVFAASGCEAMDRAKIESELKSSAPGCRVRFEARVLTMSPCEDGESAERASRYVAEQCARLRALHVLSIHATTWNGPGYRDLQWHEGDNDTCAMRCLGRGC